MCRNIKTLHNFKAPATADEINAAASQYVRKISGFSRPSAANEAAFNRAVADVARITAQLIADLTTHAAPKDRETVERIRREKAAHRFGQKS